MHFLAWHCQLGWQTKPAWHQHEPKYTLLSLTIVWLSEKKHDRCKRLLSSIKIALLPVDLSQTHCQVGVTMQSNLAETLGKEDPVHLYSDSVKKHQKCRDALCSSAGRSQPKTHCVRLRATNQSCFAATVRKEDTIKLDSSVTLWKTIRGVHMHFLAWHCQLAWQSKPAWHQHGPKYTLLSSTLVWLYQKASQV